MADSPRVAVAADEVLTRCGACQHLAVSFLGLHDCTQAHPVEHGGPGCPGYAPWKRDPASSVPHFDLSE